MADPGQIQSELEVRGCRAELLLNDVPVMVLGPEGTLVQRIASEQLVIPGTNRLELLVEPGPTPGVARSGAHHRERPGAGELPRASAKLVRFTYDLAPGEVESRPSIAPPETIASVDWEWPPRTAEESDRSVVRFPQSLVIERELGPARGRWRWQDAPLLEPGEALRAEALAFLDHFESAFRAGRVDELWELSRQQNEDMQRCYPGLTEAFLRADLARVVDVYRKAMPPRLPRDPEATDFRLVAGGRMLQLVDADWSCTFETVDPDDGSAVGVPMLLARVDGQLRIVR